MSNTAGGAKSSTGSRLARSLSSSSCCALLERATRRARASPSAAARRDRHRASRRCWRSLSSSLAMLSAAITAMRSRPTTLPVSRISRILRVEVLRGIEQVGALLGRAGDLVFLVEDPHADSRDAIVAHALCSIAFRRPIIASTRARTCSFFCSRVARSAMSVSWRWRRARFSSLQLADRGDAARRGAARGASARHRRRILRRCSFMRTSTIAAAPGAGINSTLAGRGCTACGGGMLR